MPIRQIHEEIARTVLAACEKHGFALAGGNALMAHGIIDRATSDVDLFTDQEGGVEAAAGAAEEALKSAGFTVERRDDTGGLADIWEGLGEGMAEWIVTRRGEQTLLQMSFFERRGRTVRMNMGPVLSLEDAVAGKVAALASRAEVRDLVDTAAALERWSPEQLIVMARRQDPGLRLEDFFDAGSRLDGLQDAAFTRFGLSAAAITRLRARFGSWPRE